MNVENLREAGINAMDAKNAVETIIESIASITNPTQAQRWICANLEEFRDNCDCEPSLPWQTGTAKRFDRLVTEDEYQALDDLLRRLREI